MKTFKSLTDNGGQTIILNDLQDAIVYGHKACETSFKNYSDAVARYKQCVDEIYKGDAKFNSEVSELMDTLKHLALDIQPSLALANSGHDHDIDGFAINPELFAAGEDECCITDKQGEEIKQGKGDGAYRIILNTDVAWWGDPRDNCALIGSLISILRTFRPAELWIQQGWLGNNSKDGVTLFKLDFSYGFDASLLAFWCGATEEPSYKNKFDRTIFAYNNKRDGIFSCFVNKGLGRVSADTSIHPEIPCDLYLRGDWMKMAGINGKEFYEKNTPLEQQDKMSKWISSVAYTIKTGQSPDGSAPDKDWFPGIE